MFIIKVIVEMKIRKRQGSGNKTFECLSFKKNTSEIPGPLLVGFKPGLILMPTSGLTSNDFKCASTVAYTMFNPQKIIKNNTE